MSSSLNLLFNRSHLHCAAALLASELAIGLKNAPESWRDYLYWNAELDDT